MPKILKPISPHGGLREALANELIFWLTITSWEKSMFNYPVLECLVAFAIVFSIGYLVADSNGGEETSVTKCEVARP